LFISRFSSDLILLENTTGFKR